MFKTHGEMGLSSRRSIILTWCFLNKRKSVIWSKPLSPFPSSHMLKAAPNCSPGRFWLHCELSAELLGRKLIWKQFSCTQIDRKRGYGALLAVMEGSFFHMAERVKQDLVMLEVCVVCRMAFSVLYQLKEIIWEEKRLDFGRNFWIERVGCPGIPWNGLPRVVWSYCPWRSLRNDQVPWSKWQGRVHRVGLDLRGLFQLNWFCPK